MPFGPLGLLTLLGLGAYTVSDNIKAKAVRDKRDAEYAALTRGCTQRSRQKQFELMAKYDVFNEDGVPHRLTAHENGTNVFFVPFPVSWTVKMKKKQKETQDILSYHSQAAGCSDKARAKASGGRQPIEECGRTGL